MTEPKPSSEPRLLAIETSHRHGEVALACGRQILGMRALDEGRRHARDLVPAVRELLQEQGWRARELQAVLVNRGPGSYTGLRVGLMSAKTLAYATGCRLYALDAMTVIANQCAPSVPSVTVLVDAQQNRVYVQGFVRGDGEYFQPADELRIVSFDEWKSQVPSGTQVIGPWLSGNAQRLPAGVLPVDSTTWEPRAGTLLTLGLQRWQLDDPGDDVWSCEPLYLRPSAAEQQWQNRPPAGSG